MPGVVIIEFLYIVAFVALSLTKSYISAESGWKYNQIFHESFKFKGFGGVIFGTSPFLDFVRLRNRNRQIAISSLTILIEPSELRQKPI